MRVLISSISNQLISSYNWNEMLVKIITVGNKPNESIESIIDDYTKRLPRHITIKWCYLKHGTASDTNTSKQQESENILKSLPKSGKVILLDERGKKLNNSAISKELFSSGSDVTFIIGGAHGVTDAVSKKADIIWSLSDLVFPHQIVRLILSEQIYRSYAISTNHPYHHK
jgi:23S rRNA (pseudouridine1915-N3)-methyltransferase